MNQSDAHRRAGGAGLIAALVMVAVQLAWRVLDSKDNVVQALPELLAAAFARLTPLSLFGTITETYGSLAKRTLLTVCVIGIVAIGPWAGRMALGVAGGARAGFGRRLMAGLVVAAGLLAVTLLLILPVANLGIAARESDYTSEILTPLIFTFTLWAVVWSILSADPGSIVSVSGEAVSRRTALQSGSWAVLGLASIGVAIASLIDMFRIPKLTSAELIVQEQREAAILATRIASAPSSPVAAVIDFARLEADGRLTTRLTPTVDFYHVSKNFTDPTVSLDGWSLEISGSVATPKTFQYEELVQLATVKNITTLCCISNELNGDLIGTAEWQGVPLMDLLAQVGVSPTAYDLKFSAADDYTDSIKVEVAQDPSVLLVIGMNGAPLQDDHGFPARLIIPPIYGMKNVKWINKIEVVDTNYIGYWQERGWNDDAYYQIWGRIDYPTGDIDPGPSVMSGMASAGNRGVTRVEVSLDDAETWSDALLEEPLNRHFTWVRWAFPFEATSGSTYKSKIRVTDGEGTVMPVENQPPLPDGATGWPSRSFKVR